MAEAIVRGIKGTFMWTGRASRSEFWLFAPVAAALPVVPLLLLPAKPSFGHLATVLASALPLISAGARRLQDTGEPGHSIMLPVTPLLYFFTLLWVLGSGFNLTLGGTPWYIAYPVVFLFWIAFPVICLVSLFWIGPVLGQLLLPSQPGSNPYGPPPSEVIP